MKKNLSVILGTLILFVILYAPSAFALGFGAQVRYWFPSFEGDLRMDNDGVAGTEIDLKNDLGIDNEYFPVVEGYFGIGNHEVTLSYSMVDFSGAKNINRDIIFNGDTYSGGTYVESELKTSMIDLEYQYKFLNLENILAGFSVGIIGKIKYLDGDVRMSSSAYDNREDIQIPIPMIGLGAKIGLLTDILEARAKFVGMGYSGSFFYDGMAEISANPFPFLNIHGGYRAMSLKIDDVSDIYAKIDFAGPYAGLAVSF
jgi:outer membrane protein